MSATLTPKQLQINLETLAREHVNRWIEDGLTRQQMWRKRDDAVYALDQLISGDIATWHRTGKYPEYAEES